MAIAMRGLKVKPTYEDLIGVAKSDGLDNITFPHGKAKFLREGCILSQLDGEGMRQMQLQQEQASKETCKDQLLKQASDATGVNKYDLRQSSNAETQTNRINSMLRNTGAGDNNVNGTPTSDTGFGDNDVNPTPTTNASFGDNNVNTQCFDTTDVQNVERAATADYQDRIERQRLLAEHILRPQHTREQGNIDLARRQAE